MNVDRVRLFLGVALCVSVLATTVSLPKLADSSLPLMLAVVSLAWAAAMMTGGPSARLVGDRLVAARDLLLHLAPVALLMVAYPIAARRIDTTLDGTPLLSVLLAVSVTVPWLSQAVCLPLYRACEDLLPLTDAAGTASLERRVVAAWPNVLLQALPTILVFGLPMHLACGWSARAAVTYGVLVALHVAFVQSVVVTNITRRRGWWAFSWAVYAATLLASPTTWFLPPLLGPYPLWWTLVTNCPGRSEDGAWVRHVVVSRQSTRRRQ